MNLLFSRSSLMILESLSFTQTLYAFDFDGTLSKIVKVPSEATISDTTSALLEQLSKLVPVAIVSGRSVADLRERLKFQPPYLIGNHGLEGLSKANGSLAQALAACQRWRAAFGKIKFGIGVEVEDKTYSIAIHYRRSRNKKKDKALIWGALSQLDPKPRIVMGKSVVNLLPLGAPHKGMAMVELMKKSETKRAFYIGDDDTDEDVFSLPEAKIITTRVGYKKTSHAQFYVNRQSEINRVLKLLIRYHERNKS